MYIDKEWDSHILISFCSDSWMRLWEGEMEIVLLSQYRRWPVQELFRGQWWPWRWGPGCGRCYSFCRGRVRPEGSSPGCPPLRAGSHSPAGHGHRVRQQASHREQSLMFFIFQHLHGHTRSWDIYVVGKDIHTVLTQFYITLLGEVLYRCNDLFVLF